MKTFLAGILVTAFIVAHFTRADADDKIEQKKSKDPCTNVMCDRGRMCVAKDGISTTCVCPESCSQEYDPVCSFYNRQFNNTCEMHRFACRFGFFTGVKEKGQCKDTDDEQHCPIERLLDFHERYLAWLLISYNEEKNVEKSQELNIDDMENDERSELIEFEFRSRDTNKNGRLDPNETEVMVDRREPCMVALLTSCDFDGEAGISHDEWNTCFPLKLKGLEDEIVEGDL